MPAESSMRRGRVCSSVMVIQLICCICIIFLFLFDQRLFVLKINIVASLNLFLLGAQRFPSGKNQQKNDERPPLWTNFHKVILQNLSLLGKAK